MKKPAANSNRSIKFIAIAGCLALLAACETPHWRQGYDLGDKVKELAGAGKCDAAIKSYDKLKAEYLDVKDLHNQVARIATSGYNYGKKSFSQCLLENGRAEEVIKQFELACLPNQRTYITAQYQTFICTEDGLKGTAATAYKIAGRENPFEKNPNIVNQISKNQEYIRQVDTVISNIYKRTVTQTSGTPAETRRYYSQMHAAAAESVAYLDKQTPKCQAEKDTLCLKFLSEKRQEEVSNAANWRARLKESQEDHAAAQQIAAVSPAIIGAIGSAGAAYTAANPIRQAPQRNTSATSPTPAAVAPAVSTSSQNPYANNTPVGGSPGVTPEQSQSQRKPYKNNANSCISLRGNQLANNCGKPVVIAFCVLNPRQTKNFFDSSAAFQCPNGGLETIGANSRNGLIWHGQVMYYACYTSEMGSMTTKFAGRIPPPPPPGQAPGTYSGFYHGLCGGYGADGRMERGDFLNAP
ncbi:hypothetical protein DBR37_06420 [Herminiimonas sp. KBW02]|uniref:hypothetical protein n=1 Tax=Herminiimonas sp. KBW02 TaxID=2153363 RepID=UPI000F597971|nr:hypothetical protein [Herminiimonas sp. KBW02]RQO35979.1 hypothetical protein DBR37_06420 [Herminiimonas sp. KBW02]